MDGDEQALERERLELERERLELEREAARRDQERLEIQRRSSNRWITPASVVLPLVGVIVTLLVTSNNSLDQRKADLQAKAAEIAFQGETPHAAANRAGFLLGLFGNRLDPDFANRLRRFADVTKGSAALSDVAIESRRNLIELLALHPDQRAQILTDWKGAFPGDKWIAAIEP